MSNKSMKKPLVPDYLFPEVVEEGTELLIQNTKNGWIVYVNYDKRGGAVVPEYVFTDSHKLSAFVKLFGQAQERLHYHDGV